jgi:hypothetical protein
VKVLALKAPDHAVVQDSTGAVRMRNVAAENKTAPKPSQVKNLRRRLAT